MRDSLEVDDLPFVIGLSGMHGAYENIEGKGWEDRVMGIWNAQFAMADDSKYPDFKGNVTTADTRDYFRTADNSPADVGYHWNLNAESYFWVGDAMANAMQSLQSAPVGINESSTSNQKGPFE